MLDRKSGSLRGLTRRNVLAAGASLAAPLFIGSGARAATGGTLVWGKSLEMTMLDPAHRARGLGVAAPIPCLRHAGDDGGSFRGPAGHR